MYGSTGPVRPDWFPYADKMQHGLGFAVPMFMVLMTVQSGAARAGRTMRPAWVLAVAAVFATNAVVSEIVQARPGSGRSGDPYDTLADLLGIAVGWLAYRAVGDRVADGTAPRVST